MSHFLVPRTATSSSHSLGNAPGVIPAIAVGFRHLSVGHQTLCPWPCPWRFVSTPWSLELHEESPSLSPRVSFSPAYLSGSLSPEFMFMHTASPGEERRGKERAGRIPTIYLNVNISAWYAGFLSPLIRNCFFHLSLTRFQCMESYIICLQNGWFQRRIFLGRIRDKWGRRNQRAKEKVSLTWDKLSFCLQKQIIASILAVIQVDLF